MHGQSWPTRNGPRYVYPTLGSKISWSHRFIPLQQATGLSGIYLKDRWLGRKTTRDHLYLFIAKKYQDIVVTISNRVVPRCQHGSGRPNYTSSLHEGFSDNDDMIWPVRQPMVTSTNSRFNRSHSQHIGLDELHPSSDFD